VPAIVSELVAAAVLVVAAVTDLRRGKVYNWLTYPAIVAGLALGAARGAAGGGGWDAAWDGLANHALGAGFAFGLLVVPFMMGGIGGGDLKLMAAVGALLGWEHGGDYPALNALFYAFLVAAVLGLVLMIWRGQTLAVLKRIAGALRLLPAVRGNLDEALPDERIRVPFALAACIGVLWRMAEAAAGVSAFDALFGMGS
jgi:prepilin peptidase CpaA